MPKPKTKLCAFDTRARELKPGIWTWSVSGYTFAFQDNRGINTAIEVAGELRWLVHSRSLSDAVIFAWGVWCGLSDPRLAGNRS